MTVAVTVRTSLLRLHLPNLPNVKCARLPALLGCWEGSREKMHRTCSTLTTTPASLKKKGCEKPNLEEHYAPSTGRQAQSLPGGRSDAGGCETANATESESPGVTSRACGLCGPWPWLRLPLFQPLPALPEG